MNFIAATLLSAIAFVIGAKLLSGVQVKGFWSAIWVALIISLLSSTIGAIINFFGTPINWITFGFFSLLVDALMIYWASKLLSGFQVRSFFTALILAVVVTVVNCVTHYLTGF